MLVFRCNLFVLLTFYRIFSFFFFVAQMASSIVFHDIIISFSGRKCAFDWFLKQNKIWYTQQRIHVTYMYLMIVRRSIGGNDLNVLHKQHISLSQITCSIFYVISIFQWFRKLTIENGLDINVLKYINNLVIKLKRLFLSYAQCR